MQALLNDSDLIIYTKNKRGLFTFVNKTGLQILGRRIEDVIGRDETELFGPTIGFESWETDHQVLCFEESVSTTAIWNVHGQENYLQITKHPYKSENGEKTGILGIGQIKINTPTKTSPQPIKQLVNRSTNSDFDYSDLEPRLPFPEVDDPVQGHDIVDHTKNLNRKLLGLQSAMLAVSSSLDPDHLFQTFIWEMTELLDVEACTVLHLDEENETVQFTGLEEPIGVNSKDNLHRLDEYPLIRQVVTDKRPMQLNMEQIKPTFNEFMLLYSNNIQSLLLLPMVYQAKLIGLAALIERQKRRDFTDMEISLSQMLASQAASSILNARLYDALNEANESLKASNDELDAFAHMVAHDLKGPLGIMIGFSNVIIDEGEGMTAEDRKEFLEIISNTGRKMTNIVNGLLTLSTVRKGQFQGEPVDMMPHVLDAKMRIIQQYEDYNAEFTLPEEMPSAWGYGPWVEEIWTNFLSNAVKYGGRPPKIEVGATRLANGMVRYWVRDNGKGLTKEDQGKLFKPFSRLHQVKVEGHGLGLSIVRRIVDKLGGETGIESEVGKGSMFFFTLPESSESILTS